MIQFIFSSHLSSSALPSGWGFDRQRRIRLPVTAKTALVTAGAIGGVPGSPMPPGASLLGTMSNLDRRASPRSSERRIGIGSFLLDLPVFDRDLAIQGRRQAEDDAAFPSGPRRCPGPPRPRSPPRRRPGDPYPSPTERATETSATWATIAPERFVRTAMPRNGAGRRPCPPAGLLRGRRPGPAAIAGRPARSPRRRNSYGSFPAVAASSSMKLSTTKAGMGMADRAPPLDGNGDLRAVEPHEEVSRGSRTPAWPPPPSRPCRFRPPIRRSTAMTSVPFMIDSPTIVWCQAMGFPSRRGRRKAGGMPDGAGSSSAFVSSSRVQITLTAASAPLPPPRPPTKSE